MFVFFTEKDHLLVNQVTFTIYAKNLKCLHCIICLYTVNISKCNYQRKTVKGHSNKFLNDITYDYILYIVVNI